jgi:predicted aminopeptidase
MPRVRCVTFSARCLATLSLVLASFGCVQTCYLLQAAYGQDELAFKARSIDDVVADPSVPRETRQLLALVADVKKFGNAHGIAATGNYDSYVDLGRPAVVWVVTASHPLRFEPKTWWYPIVGTVPYLGWFDKDAAEKFGAELREEGWDVDVRGSSAYSTLGWFDDPVLSSMIKPRDSVVGDLVNVVLHESVHATHFVAGQASFNESLADWVADRLTDRYLAERLHLDRWQQYAYDEAQIDRAERAKRFHEVYQELDAVYRSKASDAEKLARKEAILEALGRESRLGRQINNATLLGSRTYHAGGPAFGKLFDHCGGAWPRFWAAVKSIDTSSFATEQEDDVGKVLAPLLAKPCPAGERQDL